MRTFLWANEHLGFTEYQFFVAHADNVDDARLFIKNQLKLDLAARIKKLYDEEKDLSLKSLEYQKLFQSWVDDAKKDFVNNISSIDKHEPSHVITAGIGMCIDHGNE